MGTQRQPQPTAALAGHGSPQPPPEPDLAGFPVRWADAERRGDTAELAALLTDDFTAVGPRGFVLDKKQWLDRYDSGALIHDAFAWVELTVRHYGCAAVVLGVQMQQSVYEGRDVDGCFRVTQTLVEDGGRWLLAAVHLSPTGAR